MTPGFAKPANQTDAHAKEARPLSSAKAQGGAVLQMCSDRPYETALDGDTVQAMVTPEVPIRLERRGRRSI